MAAPGSCLACVLLLARPAHALDPNKRLTQYLHSSWRTQDGSAPASMFTITQTSDGFLWFASPPRGIYRFDGVRFLPWLLPPKGSLTDTILNVVGDREGGLWSLSESGIAHIKGADVVSDVQLDGVVWLAGTTVVADGSLWVVRGRNAVTDAPLCQVTDRALRCFGKSDGIPISPAEALLADGNGGFWIGGQTALVQWRAGVSQVYPIEALESNAGNSGISSLARGPDGTLWIGILAAGPGLGLGQLREGTFTPFVTPNFDGSKVAVYAMIVDRHGALWVATLGRGIWRIHGTVVDHYGRTEGLSSDSVLALFEDREGIVWAATTQGIDSFRDPRITTFSASEGLGKDAALGVLAGRDGTVWVANSGSLDSIANGRVSSIRRGDGLPGSQVTSLLEDRAGNLWVGVDDGLYLFEKGRFRRLPEPDHQPLGLVVGITEDIDGNVWAACAGKPRKLVRIRDFRIREEFPATQIPPGHNLAADPQGGIWIGSLTGDLLRLRRGALETFSVHPKGNPVSHQIIVQPDGSVLAAYEDGLVGLRQGTLQRMTTENGLPCNSVISFIQDNEERWWLYTSCGVVELPDSELQRWWANPRAVVRSRHYDVFDGAQPNTPSFNSAAYSSDGRVWFATGVVVQAVDPSTLHQEPTPAVTYIESVTVDRQTFAPTEHLRLPANPRDLQIDYTSPTLLIPQKVKFRYRLDGYETDWHEAGARRQAFYTDLPPGKYSFRVIASNSDGVWSDSAAQLDFFISPAYYQTIGFRALTAAAFAALLWAAYRVRVRSVERHAADLNAFNERLMKAQEQERTRIAGELHDSVMQQITALSLVLGTAKRTMPADSAARDMVVDVQRKLIDVGTEVRQLSHDLYPPMLKQAGIAEVLQGYCDAFSHSRGIAASCDVDESVADLSPGTALALYRIAQEALGNAAKHAAPTRVDVRLLRIGGDVVLTVADDGRGCEPGRVADGGLGLVNMRERARQLGGTFELDSRPGHGTTVRVAIPFRMREANHAKGY
jgi:signal transduction histidine kinase/ligand-binding sensor domain-containing protein